MVLGVLGCGCVVHEQDGQVVTVPVVTHQSPTIVVIDGAPWVDAAAAWVSYDSFLGDFVWTYEAWVNDPLGPTDVVAVWVDVYDEWAGGYYVGSFEVFPTSDPFYWATSYDGWSSGLDPYWGGYTADVVVYDYVGSYSWVTIAVTPL